MELKWKWVQATLIVEADIHKWYAFGWQLLGVGAGRAGMGSWCLVTQPGK